MALFKKKNYIHINPDRVGADDASKKPSVPDNMWAKCPSCKRALHTKGVGAERICPHCGYSFWIGAWKRLAIAADKRGFHNWDSELVIEDPLNFPGCLGKIEKMQEKTRLDEAVLTGETTIEGQAVAIGIMDASFIMGSMGTIVGEKITHLFGRATERHSPVVILATSGSTRMQEGVFSLMQVAKTSAVLQRHNKAGLLYLTVLTDPITGGITTNFAVSDDIILAEPQSLIGFAGRHVIGQTIYQGLPDGFQKAEFLLERGFIDQIVPRNLLRQRLSDLLRLHSLEEWR